MTVLRVLSLALLSGRAVDASARPPVGVAVCGGGMRAMTEGMAIARGIGEANWPRVTHLGGASGGYWFGSQFVYSSSFYQGVVSEEMSIKDYVAKWGREYEKVEVQAIENGAYWAGGPDWEKGLSPVCRPLVAVMDSILDLLSTKGLPFLSDWMAFIGNMMFTTIEDIQTARVGDREMTGLSTATLMAQFSVPPTAYLDAATQATRAVSPTYAGPDVSDAVLPAWFVSPANGDPAYWATNPAVGTLTADVSDSTSELVFTADPYLLEIISASSSAAGLVAVQSMSDAIIDASPLNGVAAKNAKECVPWGVEALATSSLPENFTDLSANTKEESDRVTAATQYRFLDGAYTDNQGAAALLGLMQNDCADEGCPGPLKLLLVDQSNYSSIPLFADSYYSPPANEVGTIHQYGGYLVPGAQIFAETFPPEAEWLPYAEQLFPTIVLSNATDVTGKVTFEDWRPVVSTYWRGTVTSVDNEWFGTSAGSEVDLLIVRSNFPGIDLSGKPKWVMSTPRIITRRRGYSMDISWAKTASSRWNMPHGRSAS